MAINQVAKGENKGSKCCMTATNQFFVSREVIEEDRNK